MGVTLEGTDHWVFNGIPVTWGDPLVTQLRAGTEDDREMGPLGGIPVVDIYDENGGVALFNTSPTYEPFRVVLSSDGERTTACALGGSNMQRFDHDGDFYTALREFATIMEGQGIATREAPEWAFEAQWETYGFEEDFEADDILELLPLLHDLGIGSITFDSGWYGYGRGEDWDAATGDFPVNPDTVGSEEDFMDLIETLHDEGFRVRLWWVPGVAEPSTELADENPDWLMDPVVSSTEDTSDVYLDPRLSDVIDWNRELVERFMSYGADGFKQDDVYQVISDDPEVHRAYNDLFMDIFDTAEETVSDVAINTCNCGVAQNFYDFPGENLLITSDPVGSRQFRMRARVLQALNVNGAALLGDHVELTQGDVGIGDLEEPGFYDTVDFASIVPLGLVLQTKLREDPGELYRTWFGIYRDYAFYDMEWVNIPYYGGVETYLLRDGDILFFSFFSEEPQDSVTLSHLVPGQTYEVWEIPSDEQLDTITATEEVYELEVELDESLVLEVNPG